MISKISTIIFIFEIQILTYITIHIILWGFSLRINYTQVYNLKKHSKVLSSINWVNLLINYFTKFLLSTNEIHFNHQGEWW